jgi:uncharacterized protein (DUF885 family)
VKRWIAGLGAAMVLLSGWYVYRLAWGVPLNINHFADRSTIRLLLDYPGLLTSLGAIDNTVLDFHSHRLADLSPQAEQERVALLRRVVGQLGEYDRTSLRGQQALTYDYLQWAWGARLALYEHPYHFTNLEYYGPYPVNQTSGAQEIPLTVLSEFQRIVDQESADRFLERMGAIPVYLDHLGQAMRVRAALGVVPPRVIMDRLITRVEHLLSQPLDSWSVYTAFAAGIGKLPVGDEERRALLDRAWAQMELVVLPAYEDYLLMLRELHADAPATAGIWALPGGDAYYRALLRFYTTSDLEPGEIHQLGLERVEAIGREMAEALADLGYARGSLTARLAALAQASAETWPVGEPRTGALLSAYQQLTDELVEGAEPAFRGFDITPVEVRRVPAEEELGSPTAYYRSPALDGSRPGYFYVNLGQQIPHEPFSMRTLVAHEAVPGHHLMYASMQSLHDLPMVRRIDYLAAYSEGWALYAERLVFELGQHDPMSDIGRLQAEMFRAVRLVVDTGIHYRRWTREQAIDYMIEQTGMARVEVVSEIERYIAMPGQACAYMVGMLEILAMREDAKARQGQRFTLPDFHYALLRNGPLPMSVLGREVERSLR